MKLKFDLKLALKDAFIVSLLVLITSFVLEQYFRGIIITAVSLNYIFLITSLIGIIYVIVINNEK